MLKKKVAAFTTAAFCFVGVFSLCTTQTFAASRLLKEGMRGSDVTSLQDDLRTLGYLKVDSTGYYGDLTKSAIERLQENKGLYIDGIVGDKTFSLISRLVDAKTTTVSRSSSSTGVLKEGMEGSDVKSLQDSLKILGYLEADSTGYYGSLTKSAVERLQKSQGVYVDGIVGSKTFSLISRLVDAKTATVSRSSSSTGVLKEGMEGSDVKSLQDDLKTLGYLEADSTGYYGSLTKSAVERLQKSQGVYVDGIVGSKTLSLISRLVDAKTATATKSTSSTGSLKEEMRGSRVEQLQNDLKKLGYFSFDSTGYYGTITKNSVEKFQKAYGLNQDGIAGNATLNKISKLLTAKASNTAQTTSRGSSDSGNYVVSWFGGAENIFEIGDIADVYDVWTGRTFKIKRTYGHNHADCETLTAEDTKIMKSIYGGDWGWTRRPIIITVNGRKLAASMAGMPHAGVDSSPANTYLSKRSGGYGGGYNLDAVKGNNMSGVFDVHFLNSRTHGTNKVDSNHQNAIKEAATWAKKNNY